MTPRSQAWLGDLARVFDFTVPDDARDRAVAAMLGLTRPPARVRPTPAAAPPALLTQRAGTPPVEVTPVPEPESPGPAPAVPPPPIAEAAAERVWLPLLFPAGQAETEPDRWRRPALPAATTVAVAANPAHQLFAPRSSAAILHRAVAQPAPDGPIDVPVLIDHIARGRPIGDLPRRSSLTLRFGVELLIDQSTGMELFARDVRDLMSQVDLVVGAGRVSVSRFAYAPLRGAGSGPRRYWRPYHPGSPQVRVLVVSDFGMGGSILDYRQASADEWAAFARALSRHGSSAVALTPYPRRMWPRWLPVLFPVLPWDRKVTIGQVAALLGHR